VQGVHRLCQRESRYLQGFCVMPGDDAEKFAGPIMRRAAISTAP
jgi:hypothetical protein